jgi:DNA-binding transcriptional LysR family regulator
MYPLAVGGSHGEEADLALRHCEAGNRIHQHHQHVLAEIAEILRDRQGQVGRLSAGSSEVDTTTTERARPATPRTCDFHQPAHQPNESVNLDVDVDDLFIRTARSARRYDTAIPAINLPLGLPVHCLH